jgi:hypothetical protein
MPYSKRFRRGALAGVDGRGATARYARTLEVELCMHLGVNEPTELSVPRRLLLQRVVKTVIQVEAFDRKLEGEDWTDLDVRTHAGLGHRLESMLKTLGLDPVAAKPKRATLADLRGAA